MANRRFEMFEYRQVLTRMRLGDTDRAIARAGLMGRRKLAQLRRTAEAAGWLDVATPLPGDPRRAKCPGCVRVLRTERRPAGRLSTLGALASTAAPLSQQQFFQKDNDSSRFPDCSVIPGNPTTE